MDANRFALGVGTGGCVETGDSTGRAGRAGIGVFQVWVVQWQIDHVVQYSSFFKMICLESLSDMRLIPTRFLIFSRDQYSFLGPHTTSTKLDGPGPSVRSLSSGLPERSMRRCAELSSRNKGIGASGEPRRCGEGLGLFSGEEEVLL